jgi:NADH:ubiquinone oxidoreductase subunit 3 (subunit A)
LGYLDSIYGFTVFNFFVVIFILWFVTFIGSFFYNKKEYEIKNEFYECGFKSISDFNFKLNSGTFASMIFVVFYDVELLFTIPYIVNEDNLGIYEYYNAALLFYVITFTF